ncbi:glycosyltransferase family 4 protein [Ferrovum myxofaciens]|uniref:glycosyltransferase family 4 protein n=1 Tax=Ferrovum myxofaciens TaxID=416213 RepID=UPI003EBE1A01
MRWKIEKHLQPWLAPRWRERRRVRFARQDTLTSGALVSTTGLRRLFVDVSVIARHDAGTGIQRVVRHVALDLLHHPPAGWQVIPIGATRKRPYHPIHWPGEGRARGESVLSGRPGDVFLGLDYALDTVCFHESQLAELRRQGVALWFMMYDLLPWQYPAWFSDKMVVRFRKWLGVLARRGEGFLCISPSTELVLSTVLAEHYGLSGVSMRTLPMGWDFAAQQAPALGGNESNNVVLPLGARSTLLMVGTLEPRKGHADILAAFEQLWQEGRAVNLVFVGRSGWKTEQLQKTLRVHPYHQRYLFWLDNVTDEDLAQLYAVSTGVIAASYAEGFGLPLLEALGYGKPVLARDIPVFHTLESEGLTYFPQLADTATLAQAIVKWLETVHEPIKLPELPTWGSTAHAIVEALEVDPCVKTIMP